MFLFGNFIQPHKEPLRDSIQTLKTAYDAGIDTGDFMHAGFSLATHSNSRFFSGEELSSFAQDMASYSAVLAQVRQYSAQAYINLGKQTAENLIESVEQPHCLIGNSYNETVMLPKHQQDNDGTAIAEAYIYKLLLAYCFGDYANAINYANQAQSYLIAVSGSFFVPIFYFYAALAHLTRLPSQSESEQAEILAIAQTYQTSLAQFAHHAPMNHQHKLDLIEAEKHRVLGNNYQAGDWYDRAITTAKTHEYLPEEALANELAAKFYRNWGKERVAAGYMQQAYYCYARWGAKGKTDQLENLYPHLLQPILHSTIQPLNLLETLAGLVPIASITHSSHANHSSSTSINTVLDLATILKVAQNLSGTIQIRDLLRQLTQIILTYSGGDRCAIILPQRNNTWQLEAFATPTATEFNPVPLNSNLPLPVKLINYVKNTLEVVVIDRLVTDLPVIDDYLTQQQPQSILCLPLLNQGKAIAILYLENQLTSGVFSRDRLLILHFLCTQAAISLENARLFSDRQTAEAQLQEINAQLTHSIQLKDEFLATMSHELRTPLNAILGMTETLLDEVFGLVNEKQIEALQTIEQSGYHLLKLISDILDVSKIASGQIDLEFAETAILPLCQQSLEFIQPEAEKKSIQVVSKLPTELPELYIDALRIRQALIHLLNNAVKFTPPGGQITVEARIASVNRERDYLRILVKDTGIGIAPENLQKVFEPFTQIDSSLNRKYEGIGLGLALVKRIVELHSGDVSLTSALEVGSCFTISLPVLSAEC
ncbi:sensor histidine kinase [Nostoc sp. CMAA1605]|uniref:sensor histidine kinase n=1 Tax=Nostoc sp. CMAA1605 TaxID=2055159 RepID=UPI001F48D06D|nr:HAMP domain-containing sensor histidine kinase [Nostoc sp. CMAA1605]